MSEIFTGREPVLSQHTAQKRSWRLSWQNLGNLLHLLPPESVSIEAAEAALHHKEFYIRYTAGRLLSRRADRDAWLVMQRALQSEQAPVRASAARFLYGFSWYSAESLLRLGLEDADERVREASVYALCDCYQGAAYQILVQVLEDEIDMLRAAAAWGLRDHRDPAAVAVLEKVLLAEDADVRIQALEVLGANEIPQALPLVLRYLYDPNADVRYAAVLSWMELAGEKCLPELAAHAEKRPGAARQPVLRALFHACNYLRIDLARPHLLDAALQLIGMALSDEVPETRLAAVWPLAWIHHPRAGELLRQAYESETVPAIKAQMLHVAYSLFATGREVLLASGQNDPALEVREMAERILEEGE